MAFSDFAYPDVLQTFGLSQQSVHLFAGVAEVPASSGLRAALAVNTTLATLGSTEAARSTWLVGPVLSELWGLYHGRVGVYCGFEFNADPDHGLNGYCDFIISQAGQLPQIAAPVAVVVEAKRDNLENGFGQCIAGMVGSLRFNQRAKNAIETIYGVVTTGVQWRFLQLKGSAVMFDLPEYALFEVDRLLGILTHILGPVPGAAAA